MASIHTLQIESQSLYSHAPLEKIKTNESLSEKIQRVIFFTVNFTAARHLFSIRRHAVLFTQKLKTKISGWSTKVLIINTFTTDRHVSDFFLTLPLHQNYTFLTKKQMALSEK